MSKILKRILLVFGIGVILIAGIYFGLVYYYSLNFTYGTWINGSYCTGKTIQEVQDDINKTNEGYQLTVVDKDGKETIINGDEIGFQINIKDQLSKIKSNQNPFLWPTMLTESEDNTVTLNGGYNKSLLIKVLNEQGLLSTIQAVNLTEETVISHNENGYELEEKYEDVINEDKLLAILDKAIFSMQDNVTLTKEECYDSVLASSSSVETENQWKQINKMQNSKIIYDFGDKQEILDNSIIHKWIVIDQNKEILLDKDQIKEYVKELAAKYDTVGAERAFKTHDGRDIVISGGPYGFEINQKKETEKIIDDITNGVTETREPVYNKEGFCRGENDIGSTYIEIDLGQQLMFYFQDGNLLFQSDVVTGNINRGLGSPTGVCYVQNKARNAILRGPGYAVFVNYWMKINGGVGIHDATWRSKFGGKIYKSNGSHGCINTPLSNMKELFNMMEVGTPVVMYYGDDA